MIDDQNYELFIANNECMALSIIKQNTMWRHLYRISELDFQYPRKFNFWHSRSTIRKTNKLHCNIVR